MTIDCGVGLFMGVPMRTICSKELVVLNVYTLLSPTPSRCSRTSRPERSCHHDEIHDSHVSFLPCDLLYIAFVFVFPRSRMRNMFSNDMLSFATNSRNQSRRARQ